MGAASASEIERPQAERARGTWLRAPGEGGGAAVELRLQHHAWVLTIDDGAGKAGPGTSDPQRQPVQPAPGDQQLDILGHPVRFVRGTAAKRRRLVT